MSILPVLAGCGASDSAPTSPPDPGSSGSGSDSDSDNADRAIAEADIIQLDGGLLYAMSKSGTVSIVDVSVPGKLVLRVQTKIPGEPFEMYRRGSYLVTMANGGVSRTGSRQAAGTSTSVDAGGGALVSVLDPNLKTVASLEVPGELADSRIVGDILYLATYTNGSCYRCSSKPRTIITSFDIADPLHIQEIDQEIFESNAPETYSFAWGSHWKRSIFVNDQRLYVGGHADIDPQTFSTSTSQKEGIIDVVDISDPHGKMERGAHLVVAGAVLSRWQMDELGGVFRVVSQRGAGRTGNGVAMPEVVTFSVGGANAFSSLGSMTMKLPRQEGLRTVRFDGLRAYAITYNQTDPLFTIDLSQPSKPVQRGELFMPGFMFHLEPHGDRLIGLGIDRADSNGSLNVSLFDVHDMDKPTMIKRVAFATPKISEDYMILNGEIAEDQDRIQKAFRVLDDGLVVVPFTALRPYGSSANNACANEGGGVQLVSWKNDTLEKKALLPVPGNPRRAFLNNGEIVAVSDSNVRSFSGSDLGSAKQLADLVIGTCTTTSSYTGGYNGGVANNNNGSRRSRSVRCSMGGDPVSGAWSMVLIGLAIVAARRKKRY